MQKNKLGIQNNFGCFHTKDLVLIVNMAYFNLTRNLLLFDVIFLKKNYLRKMENYENPAFTRVIYN